ncbi:MAG: type II toxin-antitoxin system VapC family toxin [Parachlamydiaceae bacterium]|nr:type II toxin-antitoxin system VapC family toxin [Parachlamydiaceae bacterium]
MIEKYLIDTDVLIDYLRGNIQAVKFLKELINGSRCFLSSITIAELYAGVREGEERYILDQFIQEFQMIPLNADIAMKGGIYRRDYGKSHGLGLADALIAASAEDYMLHLVTLNKKHYPMLKEIKVPYLKISPGL